jgi:hypothetical protein
MLEYFEHQRETASSGSVGHQTDHTLAPQAHEAAPALPDQAKVE